MKYRSNFVSNSSTSSFVLVVTKQAHEAAMEQLSFYGQAVIEEMKEEENLAGLSVVVLSEMYTSSYSTWKQIQDRLIQKGIEPSVEEVSKYGKSELESYLFEEYQRLVPKDQRVSGGCDF